MEREERREKRKSPRMRERLRVWLGRLQYWSSTEAAGWVGFCENRLKAKAEYLYT
jgi:hypothetical protein